MANHINKSNNFAHGYTNFHHCEEQAASVTGNELVAAPGAGLSIYLTDLIITCDATGEVTLLDGSTAIVGKMNAAIAGSFSHSFETPIKLTANTALNWTIAATGGGTCTVTGFIAP